MQCKYHPKRVAEIFCASCNSPLCKECAEDAKPGQFYCFECAMLYSVSEVGTSIKEKREKGEERKEKEKKKWGPFQYFVIVSSALILVMWGVIIFGGQKAPPRTIDFAKKGRVLLFMVDGALKRYAHYEGNEYPEKLSDLVPKYLILRKEELFQLEELSYQRDPKAGYRLSLAKTKTGEMNVILTPGGIEYIQPPSSGGA
ncbi:MAG: hypothetical protein HWN70_01240 [Desulfobacterales bacterium]|nr:hypothetical protein [Desulfobacterales bacterium]